MKRGWQEQNCYLDNSNTTLKSNRKENEYLEGIMTKEDAMFGKKELLFRPKQTSFVNEGSFELEMRNGGSNLHQAVTNGSVSDVRVFLLDEEHNIDKMDAQHGMTALHMASKYNRIEIVNLLLDFGASVDSKSTDGSTALHIASRYV